MASTALQRLDKAFPVKASQRSVQNIGKSQNRKYEGADRGKRAGGFPLNHLSANKDIGMDADLLRGRSRFLYQNTPYGKRAINSLANGIVGTGIQPKPLTANKKAMSTIKRAWKAWAEETVCDFNGRLDFYGIEKLAAKTYKRDGEVIILRRRVPSSESPIGIQLQVLEMEYLASYISYQILPGGGYTMNGIEYDKRGKVLFYWLHHRHPSEYWTQPEKYPASDVIHVLTVDYPGQNRGVSSAAPTIIAQKDLGDYEDAELVGKKIQASHALFRVTTDPEKFDNLSTDPDDYDQDEDMEKVEPGTIYHLFPGEQIQSNTPPTSPGAEDYRKSKHRNIAAGYDVTYEMMTGDYSQVNFSSGRMGWIEHQRTLDHDQWMTMVPQFCKRAYGWFLEQLPMTPGSEITKIPTDLTVSWSVPKREMLDPVKETNALKNKIRTGLMSLQEAIRQQGDDPEEVIAQIIEDLKKFKDAGISAEWSPNLDALISTPAKMNGQASRSVEDQMNILEEILDQLSTMTQNK